MDDINPREVMSVPDALELARDLRERLLEGEGVEAYKVERLCAFVIVREATRH